MLAKVRSCALVGLEGELVEVEVDSHQAQMPAFNVVGLPDAAVQESRERVRSAIRNSGTPARPYAATLRRSYASGGSATSMINTMSSGPG